ncbi:unnamed protein product [Didymodactylos carnosus]|uniref:Uncharacterized protein n=1 Tax=Didymodactylos carnosus TaxID=1234261 RepID=A0A815HH99_9BILA|nr:unnamed protein product [Didymodactylos carnosus]CAF1354081.1 unnamed protein product [Didymodactylos carnosus]CAF3673621.1 unnamed protein product [Didymodactylos carnosus]CAF4226560.1 unnamed protein product [Didymodactylos carnosus]
MSFIDLDRCFQHLNLRFTRIVYDTYLYIDFSSIPKIQFENYFVKSNVLNDYCRQVRLAKLGDWGLKYFHRSIDIEKFVHLRSIKLECFDEETFDDFTQILLKLSHMKCLSSIHIEFAPVLDLPTETLNVLKSLLSLSNLKTYILNNCRCPIIPEKNENKSNIEKLRLCLRSLSDFSVLSQCVPKIKSLSMNLRYNDNFQSSRYPVTLHELPWLQTLEIRLKDTSFDEFEEVLKQLSNLKKLSFTSTSIDYINGQRWQHLLSCLPVLKVFRFNVYLHGLSESLINLQVMCSSFQNNF